MIDFSTLQGLTIPEGVVTKIERNGVVLWEVPSGGKVILEVEKITSDTYAAETTYTGEQFILLDIYPKTNGTVKVTYGGLTKTITDTSGAEEPNAQQVFFGTFNGVSDEVETPASGELVISGDCAAFGCGGYSKAQKDTIKPYCFCVTEIVSFGAPEYIPNNAFANATYHPLTMETIVIPKSVTRIGAQAFCFSQLLRSVTIGENVTYIGDLAFDSCPALTTIKVLNKTPAAMDINAPTNEYSNFGNETNESFVLEQIVVPAGCGVAYKAADGWSEYADKIVEAS